MIKLMHFGFSLWVFANWGQDESQRHRQEECFKKTEEKFALAQCQEKALADLSDLLRVWEQEESRSASHNSFPYRPERRIKRAQLDHTLRWIVGAELSLRLWSSAQLAQGELLRC